MHTLLARLAALVALALVPLIAPSPAGAVGTGDPVIVTPADGSRVSQSWTGPVTVDFTDAPAGSYSVSMSCDVAGYELAEFVNYDGSQHVYNWPAAPFPEEMSECEIHVIDIATDGATASDHNKFWVGPALALTDVTVAPTTFYPKVRDGYRDTTTIGFRLNRGATVRFRVLSSTGTVVRRAGDWWFGAGQRRWTWNGRKTNGDLVTPGTYTIEVVTQVSGITRKATRRVTVATGLRTIRKTLSMNGVRGKFPLDDGYCYTVQSNFSSALVVICKNGTARGRYTFAIPRKAFNVKWSVAGSPTEADHCCAGRITKSGSRVSPRKFVVTVSVGKQRQYEIRRVKVTYSIKKLA